MRGERNSNEERAEQEAKIKQLTNELDGKIATHNVLSEQIKRVHVRQHHYVIQLLAPPPPPTESPFRGIHPDRVFFKLAVTVHRCQVRWCVAV